MKERYGSRVVSGCIAGQVLVVQKSLRAAALLLVRQCQWRWLMSVLLTMLVIPMPPYSTILQKCELKNPVYELLANGFIDHGENRDDVQILCDDAAAKTIVDFITGVAPQVLPAVRQIPMPPDTWIYKER